MPAVADRVPWRALDDGVYVRLLGRLADDAGVDRLLDRCARDAAWALSGRGLVEETPHAAEALGRLVAREQPAGPDSADFISGLIKAVGWLPAEDAVPSLVRLAAQSSGLTSRSMPLARSAIRVLGTVPGELVPPALHRLASESPLAPLRRAAYSELKRRLKTLDDAPEWTVGTFGLDADSRIRLAVGRDHVAVVQVKPGGRVQIRYHDGAGRALSGKPTAATLDADAMRDAATLVDQLRAAVRAARTRLESAQKELREIPASDWLEHYMAHPVTGPLARTLLWDLHDGESGWRIGLPRQVEGRWCLITADTERMVPGDDALLRVAVPRRLPADQARAWTRLLARYKVKPVLEQIVPRS
jgi:hypothetical protein